MPKPSRKTVIAELLQTGSYGNQSEILHALAERGVEATQASISRDLRELGVVKVDGVYRSLRAVESASRSASAADPLAGLVVSFETVGANLVIVRTQIGAASSIAISIDRMQLSDVVGTIAGDDTIFIAVRSRTGQGRLLAVLKSWQKGGAS